MTMDWKMPKATDVRGREAALRRQDARIARGLPPVPTEEERQAHIRRFGESAQSVISYLRAWAERNPEAAAEMLRDIRRRARKTDA